MCLIQSLRIGNLFLIIFHKIMEMFGQRTAVQLAVHKRHIYGAHPVQRMILRIITIITCTVTISKPVTADILILVVYLIFRTIILFRQFIACAVRLHSPVGGGDGGIIA